MKRSLVILACCVLFACNVSVDHEDKKDSTKLDSLIDKADQKMDKWGDSAKEKYKDARDDVKEKFRRDSGAARLQ
ncbi:MAG: hypothetical protein K0Q66_2362 [Chitinophagaceae bacterium]|jgi:ElaB/YqjD/DUF883 family membrane-anchored ribosome-binding protein|nr:hypothetical protein [Chitinophagaceae bacterium]